MTTINQPHHCQHIADLYWAQARFYDELDREAERRGHERMSYKFACCAAELRFTARVAEAAARGEPLDDVEATVYPVVSSA
jgi:hypothetical protein